MAKVKTYKERLAYERSFPKLYYNYHEQYRVFYYDEFGNRQSIILYTNVKCHSLYLKKKIKELNPFYIFLRAVYL